MKNKYYTLSAFEGKAILLATVLASSMGFLDGTIVNIALPTLQKLFGATIGQIQWVASAYSLLLGALMMVSGALGDRYGRKRVFSLGIVVFMVSSLLCSISTSINQLIIFRGIQGIGAALVTPGSLAIINSSFEGSVRGKAIGWWSGLSGAVGILGPLLGGVLIQSFGWPSIFYINIPLGLFTLYITQRYVPEGKNEHAKSLDIQGALFLFLSLFGIIYGLMQGPDVGWNNPSIVISLLLGCLFFGLFIYREKTTAYPLVDFRIFKSPLVAGANLATLFLYFALAGVIFFLSLNFQQIQHFSPLVAGMSMLPTILLITLLSGPAGSLADRIGPRMPMILGPTIVGIGMSLFILPGRDANYFIYFLPGLILFGLGMALVIAPLTKSALAVDERYSGIASGTNNAVSRIANLLAVALLGILMVSVFSGTLDKKIATSSLSTQEQQVVMNQKNKIAAIQIPQTFNEEKQKEAQHAVEDSFVYGFRVIMAINAGLAFLSAASSYLLIRNKK